MRLLLHSLIALIFVALGGQESASISGNDGPSKPAVYYLAGDGVEPSAPGKVSIAQKNKKFVPSLVSVAVGGTVTFPNRDDLMHNVYSPEGAMGFFDLGSSQQTKEDGSNLLSKVMEQPGVVEISCAIHPVMKGTIFVVPSKYHTTSVDGSYSFSGVEPGSYDLMVMDESGSSSKLKSVEVE